MKLKKSRVWYQYPDLSHYVLRPEAPFLAGATSAAMDPTRTGKKQTIKRLLQEIAPDAKTNPQARELHLLANKVQVGDYVVFPLDEKGLRIVVGQVTGPYRYAPEADPVHGAPVQLVSKEISKEHLALDLYRALSHCVGTRAMQRLDVSADELRQELKTLSAAL